MVGGVGVTGRGVGAGDGPRKSVLSSPIGLLSLMTIKYTTAAANGHMANAAIQTAFSSPLRKSRRAQSTKIQTHSATRIKPTRGIRAIPGPEVLNQGSGCMYLILN